MTIVSLSSNPVFSTLSTNNSHPNCVPLIYAPAHKNTCAIEPLGFLNEIDELIQQHELPLQLSIITLNDEPIAQQWQYDKFSQKYCQQLSHHYKVPLFIVDNKQQLFLLVDGIQVAPQWSKLQRRIVRAGRKSELLLQAAKLDGTQQVIDATAGFGHDSLILASTGSQVTILEREPLLVLLLLIEQTKMARHKNWQKLMARLHIQWGQAEDYLAPTVPNSSVYDVIYLDPMFPSDSYHNPKSGKGAKVGKHMQAMHGLASPPSLPDQERLLLLARQALKHQSSKIDTDNSDNLSRLIVKRPINAPYFAHKMPDASWQNEVVRFDGYFG